MGMNPKRREASTRSVAQTLAAERCMCQPLSSLQTVPLAGQEEDETVYEHMVPATTVLNSNLRTLLQAIFPRSTPLSLLLLHVSQLEYTNVASQIGTHKRRRYHASPEVLEQILVNVRRAIREEDSLLVHEGTGAVLLFPDVDQHGVSAILERVYRNINLLRAETIIPPLRRETSILLGIGTYPEPGASLEQLLYHAGRVARRLILRPAITTHHRGLTLDSEAEIPSLAEHENHDTTPRSHANTNIPFMQLPTEIPIRLKQLIPYDLALTLHCVPVGRNHHCLTIAMANPINHEDFQHLQMITHMTIFPVSCEEEALNALLEQKW